MWSTAFQATPCGHAAAGDFAVESERRFGLSATSRNVWVGVGRHREQLIFRGLDILRCASLNEPANVYWLALRPSPDNRLVAPLFAPRIEVIRLGLAES